MKPSDSGNKNDKNNDERYHRSVEESHGSKMNLMGHALAYTVNRLNKDDNERSLRQMDEMSKFFIFAILGAQK